MSCQVGAGNLTCSSREDRNHDTILPAAEVFGWLLWCVCVCVAFNWRSWFGKTGHLSSWCLDYRVALCLVIFSFIFIFLTKTSPLYFRFHIYFLSNKACFFLNILSSLFIYLFIGRDCYSLGWPQVHHSPASAFQMLGLLACATVLGCFFLSVNILMAFGYLQHSSAVECLPSTGQK